MVRPSKFIDADGKKTVKPFTLSLDAKLYKAIKILAAEKEISMNDLVREGIDYVFNKYKKKK